MVSAIERQFHCCHCSRIVLQWYSYTIIFCLNVSSRCVSSISCHKPKRWVHERANKWLSSGLSVHILYVIILWSMITKSENKYVSATMSSNQQIKQNSLGKCRNHQNPREWVQTWSIKHHSHQCVLPVWWWGYNSITNSHCRLHYMRVWCAQSFGTNPILLVSERCFLILILVLIIITVLTLVATPQTVCSPLSATISEWVCQCPMKGAGRIHLEIKLCPIQKIVSSTNWESS